MTNRIKMIGLDLDGTLLTDKKEITPRTRNALCTAIDRGIIVLVATGRPLSGIPEELLRLPGMRYALTSNGAKIMDVQEGRVIEEHLLDPAPAEKALEICSKYDTLQEVYFDGKSYAPVKKRHLIEKYHRNPNMWEYMRKTRIWVDDVMEMLRRSTKGLDKVQVLFADMEERSAAWEDLLSVRELELVGSLGYNIEINAAGVNKGSGLVNLGRLLGIKREEIMACGDGDNDLLMLREVGFGVAMANGVEQVKEAADYITLSNEEDGVADAIERFALGGGERLCWTY
nr:Cof-type HAD-IIB family hydrolase [uncultured Mediterraneibacter sp.]